MRTGATEHPWQQRNKGRETGKQGNIITTLQLEQSHGNMTRYRENKVYRAHKSSRNELYNSIVRYQNTFLHLLFILLRKLL